MAASTQVRSPFLNAPSSFERLDTEGTNIKPTSAMENTASSQEINSWWNNYLAPTEPISPESSKVETKTPSFNIKGEIVFNQKETVLSQPQPSTDVSEKPTTSVSGILEKIDLSSALKVTKTVTSASKDTKKAIWELFKDYILVKPEKKDEPKKDDGKKKAPAPFNLRPAISEDRRQQIQKQAEGINRRLKNQNTSYEGVFNSDGSVRADVQALLDKTNSELEESQLKKKKEAQMANLGGTSKKGSKGPRVSTNLNLVPEDSNSASRLLG